MTLNDINNNYRRIIYLLDNRELKRAFELMFSVLAGIEDYSLYSKIEEEQDNYKLMLSYRFKGVKDPMEEQIYAKIMTSTYELAEQIRHKASEAESPLTYYSYRRTMRYQNENMNLEQIMQTLLLCFEGGNSEKFDSMLTLMFNYLWVFPLETKDVALLKRYLANTQLPPIVFCQIVSALMLGLQMSFEKEKFLLLFDAALQDDEQVKVRAYIAILVCLYLYKNRISFYLPVIERLHDLAENAEFKRMVLMITLRFILSRETEKISKKLREEILPEMMKLNPQISRKFNLRELNPEASELERNPEWEEILSDKKFSKMMEEFNNLQQEGADVMHSTFVHLKNFSFFREVANWFLPFDSRNPAFLGMFKSEEMKGSMLETITQAPFMCNSDKYSLFLSMMQMPEQARKAMMMQLDSQAAEMLGQEKEEMQNSRSRTEAIAGQYIQDLYRFYKLFPGHREFKDIFELPLDFHNLEILAPYLSDDESLMTIAESYMHKNYFEDALVVYNRLADQNPDDAVLYQKIGYCLQMTGRLDEALEAYLRADLLNPESQWAIRKIAGCYRTLKRPDKAVEYYKRYEKLNPGNLGVQLNIGHCYLELKDYNEALKYFFKVEYLDTTNRKVWRAIAWSSFLIGKYDQAKHYYKKIMNEDTGNVETSDCLNAGHTAWVMQNMPEALDYYQKAIQLEGNDFNRFAEQFRQDVPDLLNAGICDDEIAFMLDELQYRLPG